MATESKSRGRAFTLIELLVVLAVLGVLAGLVMTATIGARQRVGTAACANNLRQLALAFALYCENHNDTFPGPGSRAIYGPQPEDWIWWHPGRDLTHSAIAPCLSRFTPQLFRCPQDLAAVVLDQVYPYSYSFDSLDLEGEVNPGMSSIITVDRRLYAFKTAQVKNPSGKIMLVDEDRSTLDDSRWTPSSGSLISRRHRGRGAITFSDGHVETVLPSFGLDEANSRPGL
jgi:prepilin-type N-terminal cleavage/methylation domain-containing protein/prepilin-type processing-associated H-X9-DG protein